MYMIIALNFPVSEQTTACMAMVLQYNGQEFFNCMLRVRVRVRVPHNIYVDQCIAYFCH